MNMRCYTGCYRVSSSLGDSQLPYGGKPNVFLELLYSKQIKSFGIRAQMRRKFDDIFKRGVRWVGIGYFFDWYRVALGDHWVSRYEAYVQGAGCMYSGPHTDRQKCLTLSGGEYKCSSAA